MRIALLLATALLATSLVHCTSTGTPPPATSGDASVPSGPEDAAVAATLACTGPQAQCLYGTVATFSADAYLSGKVWLYRTYPASGVMPVEKLNVAADGTFAFSKLDSWDHYFLQAFVRLPSGNVLATVRGPFSVLAGGGDPSDGGLPLVVEPVTVVIEENGLTGLPLDIVRVQASLYDKHGAIVTDAGVSLSVGDASYSVPFLFSGNVTDAAVAGTTDVYFRNLPSPTVAEATYVLTLNAPVYGSAPVTLNLVSSLPSFTPSLTSPADKAVLPIGQPFVVQWLAPATVDFSLTELFPIVDGGIQPVPVFASPVPNAADVNSETVPGAAVSTPGDYLLTLNPTRANCPMFASGTVPADGCVLSSIVAEVHLHVQ